jgi:transcriptional regulator with XRE-family HTH domain
VECLSFDLLRLKGERIARGITQEQVAKALGINKSSWSKRENGIVVIDVDEFAIIADLFGIAGDELGIFFGKDVHERVRNDTETNTDNS